MKKLNFKKTILLSLSLTFLIGSTVFAVGNQNQNPDCGKNCEHSKHYKKDMKDYGFQRSAVSILMNKYGYKIEDINKARENGKTVFDLAKDKGLSAEQLRTLIIAPRLKTLDEMITTGELSKDKAEAVKARIKDGVNIWDGKLQEFKPFKEMKDKEKKHGDEQAD